MPSSKSKGWFFLAGALMGDTIYPAVFNMSDTELAAAEEAVGGDVVRRISALRSK